MKYLVAADGQKFGVRATSLRDCFSLAKLAVPTSVEYEIHDAETGDLLERIVPQPVVEEARCA